jgi:hypothetical protein
VKKVGWGSCRILRDDDIMSEVIEVMGDLKTNYITCPSNPKEVLAITLSFFIMIIKNMRFFYSFEVQVLDNKNIKRTFQLSNITVHYFTIFLLIYYKIPIFISNYMFE